MRSVFCQRSYLCTLLKTTQPHHKHCLPSLYSHNFCSLPECIFAKILRMLERWNTNILPWKVSASSIFFHKTIHIKSLLFSVNIQKIHSQCKYTYAHTFTLDIIGVNTRSRRRPHPTHIHTDLNTHTHTGAHTHTYIQGRTHPHIHTHTHLLGLQKVPWLFRQGMKIHRHRDYHDDH